MHGVACRLPIAEYRVLGLEGEAAIGIRSQSLKSVIEYRERLPPRLACGFGLGCAHY
jgi:hypothetical protein